MAIILAWMLVMGAVLTSGSLTPPSQDPFYHAPSGFESSTPGSILRLRKTPYRYQFPLEELIDQGHQILYRTTDTFGQPTIAVATILVPASPDVSKLYVYQPFTVSACADCAPSYAALADDAPINNNYDRMMTFTHRLVIAAALSQGWMVTVTDHEGPDAAFMANLRGAHAVLDGVRASLASNVVTGISPTAQVVLMGYSAGSSPTALAAEIQAAYAPDLERNLLAVAIGGLLPSVAAVMDFLVFDWTVAASMWGLAREYPVVHRRLLENLRLESGAQAQFKDLGKLCAGDLINEIGNSTWRSYFTSMDFLNASDVQQIFRQNSLYQGAPGVPVFVYESAHDNTSPNVEIDRLVSWYCAAGTQVEYRKFEMDTHRSLALYGHLQALAWLRDRFSQVELPGHCTNSSHLSVPTDLSSWLFLGETTVGGLKEFLAI